MYIFDDVNISGPGVGAAVPKDPNVHIVRSSDISVSPIRNSKGVLMVGNYVLKPGAKIANVYMTGVNQDATYETSGEVDAEQYMQKFIATHPGDDLEFAEFTQNNLGVDLIVIYGTCTSNELRVYGTKCAPMRLKNNFQANKDKTGHTLTFEQIQGTRFVPGHYRGVLPTLAPAATDVSIDLLKASGYQFKVEALDVTDEISLTDFDFENGDTITLIGSGGAAPATLTAGDKTVATVILSSGTTWTALDGATISFEVVDGGATIYLVERQRTA
ncbi:hypothetical protein [Sediminibacter sp. Hel_I_10]|uniref:hypothetical protein n=1 Tax=Sediminibacter sp. Hel_I_10 TaxID=1392490 RepID=UPI00047DDC31|nr:hypothetical protein [Sediminibacter sp. Hel_I_10]